MFPMTFRVVNHCGHISTSFVFGSVFFVKKSFVYGSRAALDSGKVMLKIQPKHAWVFLYSRRPQPISAELFFSSKV